jgi:hypothetical protein
MFRMAVHAETQNESFTLVTDKEVAAAPQS